MANDNLSISSTPKSIPAVPKDAPTTSGAATSTAAANLDIEHGNRKAAAGGWGGTSGLPPLPESQVSGVALTVALQDIVRQLRLTVQSSDATRIKAKNKRLQEEHKKNIAKLKNMEKKIEEQRSKSKCSRVFGWVAAALTMIVAVVATVVTGGTAAPLIGVAALGITMMALQQSGKMKDVVQGLAKGLGKMIVAFGGSKKEADKISKKMAVGLIAAIVVVASIAGTIASGGSGGASAAEAVEETEQLSEMGANLAEAGESASESASSASDAAESSSTLSETSDLGADSVEDSSAFSDLTDSLNDTLEGIDQGATSEESPMEAGSTLEDSATSSQETSSTTATTAEDSASQTAEDTSSVADEKLDKSLTRMQKIDKAVRMTSLLMESAAQAGKGAVDIQAGQAQASATRMAADSVGIKETIRAIAAQRDNLVPDMKRTEKYAASLEKEINAILATDAESTDFAIQNMRI